MERRLPVSQFDTIAEARQALREDSLRAIEVQSDYVAWLKTDSAAILYQGFMESYGYTKIAGTERRDEAAFFMRETVGRIMAEAPTYYVSHDMTAMVAMAAEDMPRDGLSPVDLLTDTGFLVYDHPVKINGPTETGASGFIEITAVAWEQSPVRQYIDGEETSAPGITYFLFTDPTDLSRYVKDTGAKSVTYFSVNGEAPEEQEWVLTDEERAALMEITSNPKEARRAFGPVFIYDFSGWSYGQEWEPIEDGEPDDLITTRGVDPETGIHKVAPVVDDARRLLSATWRMLNQKVVTLESQHPPRAMRRRIGRNIPDPKDVTVVRLRREYHPEGGEDFAAMNAQAPDGEGRWYSHRFLVKGHWRRQHCGPNGEDRKLVWIAPYVKGPEDRPLILGKQKVWSLEQ